MIIIGNPDTLRHDQSWYDLMKFCKENGGCTQKANIGKRPENNPVVYSGPAEFNYHLKMGAKNQNIYVGDFF
jgi:superfamily I DNA and/or RNA helicase